MPAQTQNISDLACMYLFFPVQLKTHLQHILNCSATPVQVLNMLSQHVHVVNTGLNKNSDNSLKSEYVQAAETAALTVEGSAVMKQLLCKTWKEDIVLRNT